MAIAEILSRSRVIPVLTIERAVDAVPLARALLAGGLPVLEITLRTDAALAAVSAIAAALPDALPGVGTALKAEDLAPARQAERSCLKERSTPCGRAPRSPVVT